ncbi:MAG TPA: ribosomal protein L7/L12 [bacterium]|nr:ribosomal protein L7/L12 [bacterium]
MRADGSRKVADGEVIQDHDQWVYVLTKRGHVRRLLKEGAYAFPAGDQFKRIRLISGPASAELGQKIPAIKAVREACGLGLKEAKDWIETTDRSAVEAETPEQARLCVAKLAAVGYTAALVR